MLRNQKQLHKLGPTLIHVRNQELWREEGGGHSKQAENMDEETSLKTFMENYLNMDFLFMKKGQIGGGRGVASLLRPS